MNSVDIRHINLRELTKINSRYNYESIIYHDDLTAYKIYKPRMYPQLKNKENKIELLHEEKDLTKVILPKEKILYRNFFCGYTMDYLPDSIKLQDFKIKEHEFRVFLEIIFKLSKNLQMIHNNPNNISVGDLNDSNILLDKDFNPYFIDFDSCSIKNYNSETLPIFTNIYLENKEIDDITDNQNIDRLSMLLMVIYMIYETPNIINLPLKKYDELAEQLNFLKNIKSIIRELQTLPIIPNIPYLHELIPKKELRKII